MFPRLVSTTMTGPPEVVEDCCDWSPGWLFARKVDRPNGFWFWLLSEMEMTSPRPRFLAMSAICAADDPAK